MRYGCLTAVLLAACAPAWTEAWAADCNRQAFASCQVCHALTTDAGQKPGPQLVRVVGRQIAGDPAFDYSPQLQAARATGDRWTKERLDIFLSDPQAMYPGTWMGSPPIRNAKQRADLLCVLDGP